MAPQPSAFCYIGDQNWGSRKSTKKSGTHAVEINLMNIV